MNRDKRNEVEIDENWGYWVDQIPYIRFREEYLVKIVPPFNGAIARYYIKYKEQLVSVYLDCFDKLGISNGTPYWEIYSFTRDIPETRVDIYDAEGLQKEIDRQLGYKKED